MYLTDLQQKPSLKY